MAVWLSPIESPRPFRRAADPVRRVQHGPGRQTAFSTEIPRAVRVETSHVPAYVTCPHCRHPKVVPDTLRGKFYRCRQCRGFYLVPGPEPKPSAIYPAMETPPNPQRRAV